jgi:hypothetical protein
MPRILPDISAIRASLPTPTLFDEFTNNVAWQWSNDNYSSAYDSLEEFLSGGNEVEALRKLQAGQSSSAIQGMYQVAHDTFRPSSTFWYLELASCYYPDPTDLWGRFRRDDALLFRSDSVGSRRDT